MRETNASVMRKYQNQILAMARAATTAGVSRGYLSRSNGIHAAFTCRSNSVVVRWGGPWEDGGTFAIASANEVDR